MSAQEDLSATNPHQTESVPADKDPDELETIELEKVQGGRAGGSQVPYEYEP
jgi:hypothetical protein